MFSMSPEKTGETVHMCFRCLPLQSLKLQKILCACPYYFINPLTLCMLGNFSCFFHLLTYSKLTFSNKLFGSAQTLCH